MSETEQLSESDESSADDFDAKQQPDDSSQPNKRQPKRGRPPRIVSAALGSSQDDQKAKPASRNEEVLNVRWSQPQLERITHWCTVLEVDEPRLVRAWIALARLRDLCNVAQPDATLFARPRNSPDARSVEAKQLLEMQSSPWVTLLSDIEELGTTQLRSYRLGKPWAQHWQTIFNARQQQNPSLTKSALVRTLQRDFNLLMTFNETHVVTLQSKNFPPLDVMTALGLRCYDAC